MGWPSNCFISLRQGSSSVQRNGSKWQVAEENDGKDRFICFWMIFGGFKGTSLLHQPRWSSMATTDDRCVLS